MTREEFQKIVDDITGGQYYPGKRKNAARGIEGHKAGYGPTSEFKETWMTGGAWGGNCWEDSSPESYSPEPDPEPEFINLDTVIERVAPSISFLQYKQLMTKVNYDTHTKFEYYGNYTTYATKKISVDSVWDFLKEGEYV